MAFISRKSEPFLVTTASQFYLLHFIFFFLLRFYSLLVLLVPRLLTAVGLAQSIERLTVERRSRVRFPERTNAQGLKITEH